MVYDWWDVGNMGRGGGWICELSPVLTTVY